MAGFEPTRRWSSRRSFRITGLLFDTCFLVGLEREIRRGSGKAHDFLRAHPDARPCVSSTVAREFAEGFGDIPHPACTALLARFKILPLTESTAHHYAVTTKFLRQRNALIRTNDLWTGAAALAHPLPLATNKATHFSRIPHLAVVSF